MKKNVINKWLGRFGVELHGKGYLQALAKGDFNSDAFQIQAQLSKSKAPIIFDIGANRGNITEKYLKLFPNAKIFAFEPFPDSYNILKEKFEKLHNVITIQKAVAATQNTKEFFVNHNVDTNSLLKPQNTGLSSDIQVKNLSSILVESIVLDDFCKEAKINYIDILKMDIQGGEYEALLGLENILSNAAVGLIYSEVYFIQQYERQPLFHDISVLLAKYGYHLQDIYNPIYGNGSIAWADVIFIKN